MNVAKLSDLATQFPTAEVDYEDMLAWPYRYGGRGATGIDCFGVAVEILRRAGIGIPDVSTTSAVEFSELWTQVSAPDTLYDLVFIRKREGHVGIVVRMGQAISATDKQGVHLDRLTLLARVPGVEYWRLKPEVIG